MKLFSFRVGVPLLRLKTQISYSKPRIPNAFERIILKMVDQVGQNALFNDIPIEQIFIDLLCVSDPGPLVKPTLIELKSWDVIRCKGDIESIDTLTLKDIEITDRGQKMIVEDMLPSTSREDEMEFNFDPLCQRLLSVSESKSYGPDKPDFSIDSSVFKDIFPEELIRSNLERGNDSRVGTGSRIEVLKLLSEETLWKEVPCTIEVKSGFLKVCSKNKGVNDYFTRIETDDTYERFIVSTLNFQHLNGVEIPRLDDKERGRSDNNIQPIPQVLSEWPRDVNFIIPGPNYDTKFIPSQARDQQVIILYDKHQLSKLSIQWNSKRSGCKVIINSQHPFQDSFRITDKENLQLRSIEANYGNAPRRVVVAFRISDWQGKNELGKVFSNISELVKSEANPSDLSILNFFAK